ncbi:MAG: response regulator [Lachnospiraceae bacterium]|nr:response regulator [Lachnospiraceae bacterium]
MKDINTCEMKDSILNDSSIGLWYIDFVEGEKPKMYADDNMLMLLGYSSDESDDLLPEDVYERWYSNIDESHLDIIDDTISKMKQGNHAEVQYPWNHPTFGTIYVRCGGNVDRTFTEGLRFMGFHQDITNLVHLQQQQDQTKIESAYKENVRYMSIASVLSKKYDVIYYINLDNDRYIEFNVSGEFRRLALDISGNNFFDECAENLKRVCYKDDLEKMSILTNKEVLLNRLGFDEFKSLEYRLVIQGRPTFYRVEAVRPSKNKNHIIIASTNINKEVVDRNKYQQQLSNALHVAEKANNAKSTFLFNVSHDMRTPLNVIKGFSDIAINNMNDKERVLDCLDKINNASEHLLHLVNDVLDMSNIESGHLEIIEEKVDLVSASEEVNSMIKYLATSKNISYVTKYDITNAEVMADISHVNQIMMNVLTNAVKYTPEGGEVTFTIEQTKQAYADRYKYRFIIKDNGVGISKDYMEHMFEDFTREKNVSNKSEGLGLGLAITKRLVDSLQGEIEVESEVGKGTTFIITLPFRITSDANESAEESTSLSNVSLEGKRILVVEDNELNSEITMEILSESGMTVDAVENGAVAVKRLKRKGVDTYDLILMDIQMPVMDGYEATRIIRNKIRGGSEIPIIALSANAFERDKINSLRAGMNAHLSKPINADVLCEVIKSNLVKRQFG